MAVREGSSQIAFGKSKKLPSFRDRVKSLQLFFLTFSPTFCAQELSAEKSKVASVETRLSSQLSKREQEMIALQARMQASYQDHVAQTQTLNAKVSSCKQPLQSIYLFFPHCDNFSFNSGRVGVQLESCCLIGFVFFFNHFLDS